MKKITVILPVHKLDDVYKIMLENAISSVEPFYEDVHLLIIHPDSIGEELKKIDFGQKLGVRLLGHKDTDTGFVHQLNKGIENCNTEWFSIFEIDDEYKPIWLKSVNDYINEYTDVDIFLPIVKNIDVNGEFLSFTNESLWAYGFTEQQGFLDKDVLLEFQNFQTSGGVYRTNVIKENGLFKENIKLTFTFEFLLRVSNNAVKVMGIPKIGYQHVNFREDSLFWNYKNDETMMISEKEAKFWLETAKKEFFFKNNRVINYVES